MDEIKPNISPKRKNYNNTVKSELEILFNPLRDIRI